MRDVEAVYLFMIWESKVKEFSDQGLARYLKVKVTALGNWTPDLIKKGFLEKEKRGAQTYFRLTEAGRQKAESLQGNQKILDVVAKVKQRKLAPSLIRTGETHTVEVVVRREILFDGHPIKEEVLGRSSFEVSGDDPKSNALVLSALKRGTKRALKEGLEK